MSVESRDRINERFWLAENHAPDSLVITEPDKFHITQSVVRFPDYAEWSDRMGFPLPDAFPGRSSLRSQGQLDPRQRKTYLKIIAALAPDAEVDLEHPHASAPAISAKVKELGLSIVDNTVARALEEVAALIKDAKKPQ
jgi:hypothetical protein